METGHGAGLSPMARITLLTDFGTRDGYVGAVKGVISAIFPGVFLDDISHDLDQGDVRGASLALERYWDRFARGTVHFAVVDPGVGTGRRALAVEVERRFLVVPDNGLATPILASDRPWRAVELEPGAYLKPPESRTFHGRDLFAPAAAYLARGIHLSRLGSPVSDPVLLSQPAVRREAEGVIGEVIVRDRFGNLVTNLDGGLLDGASEVEIAGRCIPVRQTYGEVEPGELLALANSDRRVEVAARDDSAARLLDVEEGASVRISDRSQASPGPHPRVPSGPFGDRGF